MNRATADLFAPEPTERAQARALRDHGIKVASDHAEAVAPTWNAAALAHVRAFAVSHSEITSEDVRRYAEPQGFATPPDKRAWGAVMLAAARAGIVTKIGYTEAKDPKAHCNPVTLWRSNIFNRVST